jgi:hypothetical protein
MSTYKGSGLPDNADPDPKKWPPEYRRLDELGEVEKPCGYDLYLWGVAVPNPEKPGRFLVVRYADQRHAEAVASDRPMVMVEWAHSGRWGKGLVTPLVWRRLEWGGWAFPATGWSVPR